VQRSGLRDCAQQGAAGVARRAAAHQQRLPLDPPAVGVGGAIDGVRLGRLLLLLRLAPLLPLALLLLLLLLLVFGAPALLLLWLLLLLGLDWPALLIQKRLLRGGAAAAHEGPPAHQHEAKEGGDCKGGKGAGLVCRHGGELAGCWLLLLDPLFGLVACASQAVCASSSEERGECSGAGSPAGRTHPPQAPP
jgi:hypothetical protein